MVIYRLINKQEIITKLNFLVSIMTNNELMEFVSRLDSVSVNSGNIVVPQEVFKSVILGNLDDFLVRQLLDLYSLPYIQSMSVIPIGNIRFIIKKSVVLSNDQMSVLQKVSRDPSLLNPVYINLNEGMLEIE